VKSSDQMEIMTMRKLCSAMVVSSFGGRKVLSRKPSVCGPRAVLVCVSKCVCCAHTHTHKHTNTHTQTHTQTANTQSHTESDTDAKRRQTQTRVLNIKDE
jgi:phosphoribosyl-dephospho-CoA transferase